MDFDVAPKKRVPTQLDTPLAHSFGFDKGDLQDNRSGFMSHWQKKRLRWHLLSYSVSILLWIFLLSILPFALLFGDIGQFIVLPILWIAGVLLVFGIFWLWMTRLVFQDMRQGSVETLISGVEHVRKATPRLGFEKDMDYYVMIGRERFVTSHQQMEAFKEGALYRVFVSPQSRQILSAELMSYDMLSRLVDEGEIDASDTLDDLLTNKTKGKR